MVIRIVVFSVLWSSLLYGQQWESIASMPQGRANFGIATLEGGNIVVSGGYENGSVVTTTIEYDPVADKWVTRGPLNVARGYAPMVKLLDGRLFFPSGLMGPDSMTLTSEIYTPSTGVWTLTQDLKRGRNGESAITLPNGKVLIVGGMDSETQTTHATCELYDPILDTITQTGNISHWQTGTMLFLDTPRNSVIMLSGYYVVGSTSTMLQTTEEYDIATGTWTVTADSKEPHYTYSQQSIQLPNGDVIAPSGFGTRLIEKYTSATKSWSTIGTFPESRYLGATVYIGNDSVLIIGGYSIGSSPGPLRDCRIINVKSGAVTPAPSLQASRYYHRAVVRTYSDPVDPEVEVTAVYVFGGDGETVGTTGACEKLEFRRKKQSSVTTASESSELLKSFFDAANNQFVSTDNITSDHKIELIDALGKVVFSRVLRGDEHRVEVSAAGLPSGLYVFQATTATGRLSAKVLLTH